MRARAIDGILVVEDNEAVRQSIVAILRHAHKSIAIDGAENGAQALGMIAVQRGGYALVLSDTEMPIMGGVELMENIRRDWPGISTILMSGKDAPTGHQAHAFMGKPFKLADFQLVAERVIMEKM